MKWRSTPNAEYGFYLVVQDDPGEPVLAAVYKEEYPHAAAAIEPDERPAAAAAIAGPGFVVVPRVELDDLFHDRGATDLPGIRAALGETR